MSGCRKVVLWQAVVFNLNICKSAVRARAKMHHITFIDFHNCHRICEIVLSTRNFNNFFYCFLKCKWSLNCSWIFVSTCTAVAVELLLSTTCEAHVWLQKQRHGCETTLSWSITLLYNGLISETHSCQPTRLLISFSMLNNHTLLWSQWSLSTLNMILLHAHNEPSPYSMILLHAPNDPSPHAHSDLSKCSQWSFSMLTMILLHAHNDLKLIDWLIDGLIVWLIDWLIDW